MLPEKSRTQLRETIIKLKSLGKDNASKLFMWNGRLDDDAFADTEALYVKGLDHVHVLSLPIKSADVAELAGWHQASAKSGLCISASQVTLIPTLGGTTQKQLLQNLTYQTLESMLGITFEHLEFNVEAKLVELVICREGESYHSALNSRDENGKFGTLFVQMALKEAGPSGSIIISDGTEETCVKIEYNRGYSIAAVAGLESIEKKGSFKIHSETGELIVVVIFNLVWSGHLAFRDMLPLHCFPELLVLTNQIKVALISWHVFQPSDSSKKSDEDENCVTSLQMLCLPATSTHTSELAVEDMIVAQSMMHIRFIDAHLANIEPFTGWKPEKNSQHSSPTLPNAINKLGSWFCINRWSHSEIFNKRREKQKIFCMLGRNPPSLGTPLESTFRFGNNSKRLDQSMTGVKPFGGPAVTPPSATSFTFKGLGYLQAVDAKPAVMTGQEPEAPGASNKGLWPSALGASTSSLFGNSLTSTAQSSTKTIFSFTPTSFSTTVTNTGFSFANTKAPSSLLESPGSFPSTGIFKASALTSQATASTVVFGAPLSATREGQSEPVLSHCGTQQSRGLFEFGSPSSSNASGPYGPTIRTTMEQSTARPETFAGTTIYEMKPTTGSNSTSTLFLASTTQSTTPVAGRSGPRTLFKLPAVRIRKASSALGGTTSANAKKHEANDSVKKKSIQSKSVVITDDIYDFHFSVEQYLISDIAPCEIRREGEVISVPVIVIRPKNSRVLSIGNTCRAKLMPEDLLEIFEERLVNYTAQCAIENSRMHHSLLKDLQQILGLLQQDLTTPACKRCFFSRLFNACVRVRAKNEASKLLIEVVGPCQSFKEWFACLKITCRPNALNPAASFADFISLSNGWGLFPDVLEQLMGQLVSAHNINILSDIGLNLLQIGYVLGAQKTFNIIVRSFSTLEPHEIVKSFHPRLIVLGIHLQEEMDYSELMDLVLDKVTHLEAHQLAELTEHLGRLNIKSRYHVFFMKKLGNLAKETFLSRLEPKHFLMIARVYNLLKEQEIVESLWTSLCIQCIEICNSATDLPCLFCNVLRSSNSSETCKATLFGLIRVSESRKALLCSMKKLTIRANNVNLPDFIDVIHQLEEIGILSKEETVENFITAISSMSPEDKCSLSCSLFQAKRHLINMRLSSVRKIYEWLLERISFIQPDVLTKIVNETLLRGFAWFGLPSLVKKVFIQLNAIETNERKKFAMMLDTLKADTNDYSAASSLAFNREIFNFLLSECVKALGNFDDDRTSDCVECFKLLATSERSFIDSTEDCVTTQWSALTESLHFLETVDIVKAIFDSEINHEGPCLKKFPHCWSIFTRMCYCIISKWDLDVVKRRLNESHAVSVMQCFFWIGEEKGINDLYRLIAAIPCSVKALADAHGAIIRQKITMQLAVSSLQGLLTLNDLIDDRIMILNWRLASLSSSYSGNKQQTNQSPLEAHLQRGCFAGIEMHKEIDELQSLRRDILKKILAGQLKVIPND